MRVLVPVDGSERSSRAVEHVVAALGERESLTVYLLNVQPSLPALRSLAGLRSDVNRQRQQAGQRALQHAQRLLDRAGIRHEDHVAVGPPAETIVKHARRWKCDSIVMGTRGVGKTPNLVLGSVAMKVIHLAACPVTLIN